MTSFDQTKRRLKALISEELSKVFGEIRIFVPEESKKFDTLLLLEGRYADLYQKVQRGVLSAEEQRLETNRIREQLLSWIDGLEAKDLESGRTEDGLIYKRRLPVFITLAILFLAVSLWAIFKARPFESMEKKDIATAEEDTASRVILPSSDTASHLPKAGNGPETVENRPEDKKPLSDQPVEVKLNVTSLWVKSKILVDGEEVKPNRVVGTFIMIKLTPGTHDIQLLSGEDRCEESILVREEGQEIRVNCD